MRTLPLIATVVAILVSAPGAWGASAPAGARVGGALTLQPAAQGPTVIEADEIAYDAATNIVTARGRVRVTHPRFRVFADTVILDLTGQVLTAEGRVRLIDPQGRELRGGRLVYHIDREEGTVTDAETILDQTYLRGGQVEVGRDRITVHQATVTTCDPGRPLYRITARRVDITPGEELVARDASLWLGNIRVVTLPVYRMSLRPGEQRGPTLPGVGYSGTDGLWVDYRYEYTLGGTSGNLYAKYGQRTGLFALNTLTYARPSWSIALRVGRTQQQDPGGFLREFSQAEVFATPTPARLPNTPLFLSGYAAVGWFQEAATARATSRFDGLLSLASQTLQLGPRLTATAAVSYRLSLYGTGEQRAVLGSTIALSYRLDEATTAALTHDLVAPRGVTPFLFDGVGAANTVTFAVARTLAGYRIQAAVSHNFAVPVTKLAAEVGVRLSPTLFLTTGAVYNLTSRGYEDIDYTVEYRCDCLTVSVMYRQVRGEIWLLLSLRGVSERLTFQLPRP